MKQKINQADLITRAKNLGEQIKNDFLVKDYNSEFLADGELVEYVISIFTKNENDSSHIEVWERAMNFESLLTEVLSILSNPEISKMFQPYYQKHAGELMLALINFFSLIKGSSEEVEKFLLYNKLKRWAGDLKEFEEIEEAYLSEKSA